MENALTALLSWQFIMFCLMLQALTFIIRKVVDYKMLTDPNKDYKLWSSLILPILPIILGCIIALLVKKYPFPAHFDAPATRVFFGLVAGLLSSTIYQVTWGMLKAKLSVYTNTTLGKVLLPTPASTTTTTTIITQSPPASEAPPSSASTPPPNYNG